jgi:hypothetical protein
MVSFYYKNILGVKRRSKMAENDYSNIGFILGLVGGILVLVVGGILGVIFSMIGSAAAAAGAPGFGAMFIVLGVLGILSGILMIVGSAFIKNPQKRTMGSILLLVFSIIGLFTAGGGFIVGSILGIIGAVMGLISKPAA